MDWQTLVESTSDLFQVYSQVRSIWLCSVPPWVPICHIVKYRKIGFGLLRGLEVYVHREFPKCECPTAPRTSWSGGGRGAGGKGCVEEEPRSFVYFRLYDTFLVLTNRLIVVRTFSGNPFASSWIHLGSSWVILGPILREWWDRGNRKRVGECLRKWWDRGLRKRVGECLGVFATWRRDGGGFTVFQHQFTWAVPEGTVLDNGIN